jgi:DNA polymerase elongation subunit (family B)
MTKEERIKEIQDRINFLKAENAQKDILQYALKILINSGYGAISSAKNPIGDTDLANAITTCGSTSIKQVNVFARDFVKMKNPNISSKDLEEVVIFNDTDSCCIRLDKCNVTLCEGDKVTEEGYKLVQDCDDYVNQSFEDWFTSTTGSKNCTLYFKREKICDAGVFLKKKNSDEEAKKNYILHILDNEGVKKPSFKYTGVKFARSTLTKDLKLAAKKVVEHMILTQDKASTEAILQDLYNKFKEMPLDDIVTIQRCNNVQKYEQMLEIPDNYNIGKMTFPTGTPGHVRAALNFNIIMDKLGIKGYEHVKSGDLAKIIYVHKNKFGIDKIAYLDKFPPELEKYLQIDYKTTFIKTVYDEIKRIYNSVGWSSFNPAEDYAFSLFDLMDMEPA